MIPVLTTGRLTLRAPRLSDFDAYAAMRADTRMSFLGGPQSRATAWRHLTSVAGQWLLRGYGRWIVTLTGEDTPVGLVGIHHPEEWPGPELAWTLAASAEGRGIAREAALAARRHAYAAQGLPTLISLIAAANTRSQALARRLGCYPGGTFHPETEGEVTIWRHPSPEAAA